jgi:hypothetical protein
MTHTLAHSQLFGIMFFSDMFGVKPKLDDNCMGKLLLRANMIQRKDLDDALKICHKKGSQIGHALVELGVISEDTVCQALRVQQLLREGAIDQKWAELALHLNLGSRIIY